MGCLSKGRSMENSMTSLTSCFVPLSHQLEDLLSDVLKWDCPAPLSANNEFYENRLISSFAFKILLNSLHPTFSPMHQSKMRPLLKLSWVSNHQSLTLCVHTRVCKLCITMDRLRFVSSPELPTPVPLIYSDGSDPHESADYKVRLFVREGIDSQCCSVKTITEYS